MVSLSSILESFIGLSEAVLAYYTGAALSLLCEHWLLPMATTALQLKVYLVRLSNHCVSKGKDPV